MLDGRSRLQAASHAGASILLPPSHFNPETYEWITWSWRVDRPLHDKRCFEQHLPDVIAASLMTDTDNTAGDALAYGDDLRVSRVPLHEVEVKE